MPQKRVFQKNHKPTRRDLQKQQTRERVYEAAKTLFVTKGYFETRSGDIARLAGVSHGSVFSHFKSKSEILERLHNEFLNSQIQKIGEHSNVEGTTRQRLVILLDLLWEDPMKNKKLSKVMFAQGWLWSETREEEYQKLTSKLRRIGEEILREGQEKGDVRADFKVVDMMNTMQAQFKESLRMSFHGKKNVAEARKQLHGYLDMICRS
jgi:AcrR family transcriptional regulator